MKKILYGTTALIAAGMISTAVNAAEPVKLQLGGYMDWYVAASQNEASYKKALNTARAAGAAFAGTEHSGDFNQFDVIGNGEIYFQGSTMLDNGMSVAVHVELEAGTGATDRSADESFVEVETGYGQLVLGATRNAASRMHVSAPDAGRLGVEESDVFNLVEAPAAVNFINATYLNTDGKVNKISYISPTLYGLTMGATWTPGSGNGNTADNADRTLRQFQASAFKEGYALNLKYEETLAGVDVTTTAGYAAYSVGGDDAQGEYSLGANLGYAGFTFGGAYRKIHDHTGPENNAARNPNNLGGWNSARRSAGADDSLNGYVYNVGLGYEAHRYALSLNYMKSEVDGLRAFSPADAARNGKDKVEAYQLSGSYNLGAGVDTFATIAHVDYEDEVAKTAANEDDHNKGWAFATGIALTF